MNPAKRSFLFLILVFVVPVAAGMLMFAFKDKLGLDSGTTNYGTLIRPAIPLETADLKLNGNKAPREETIAKKWTLVYLLPEACQPECQDRILQMHQLRLLMNEDMRRVRLLVVAKATREAQLREQLGDQYSTLVISTIGSDESEFLTQFPQQDQKSLYLLDPLGNLMMYYPQEKSDTKRIIKDLKRLLKYSHLG